jgi:beta-lactamase regulating signal transducer with metallopeptidase domain
MTFGSKAFLYLIDPAFRSLTLGALVGLFLLLTRAKSVSLRLSAWKIVVCAALAMPILAAYLPPLPVALPFADRIPQFNRIVEREAEPRPAVAISAVARQFTPSAARVDTVATSIPRSANIPALSQPRQISIPWREVAEAAYLAIGAFLAIRFALGWFLSKRLRRFSEAIEDREVNERFKSLAASFGLRKVPHLAASERLAVPLTCGVVGPAVLLPEDWCDWDAQKLEAVMAHELSHVARHDALTERLALVHRVFFWFSPLAWWLPRHLADLAEEASDQAALAAGTEPAKYAEILLGFLNDLSLGSKRVNWQGVAMAQAGRAEKRLDRILNGRMTMSSKLNKSLIALVAFSSVPVVLLAASLHPRLMGHQIELVGYPGVRAQQSAPPQPPATATPANPSVAPTVPVSPTPAVAPVPHAIPVPSAAPVVAAAVAPEAEPAILAEPAVIAYPAPRAIAAVRVAPMVIAAPAQRVLASIAPIQQAAPVAPPPSVNYSFSTDGAESYAIISGKSSTMSGSFARGDFQELEALHQKMNSDFIWFERDGKSYIITDPETVQRAEAAFAAQSALGEKQGVIGEQLGSLGELQGVLGEQEGLIGEQEGMLSQQMEEVETNMKDLKIQMPDISSELQSVQEHSKELGDVLSQKDMDELRANMEQMREEMTKASKEIAEAQARSGALKVPDSAAMNEAIQQARESMAQGMAKFSAEQSKLGVQQEALARAQEALGKEQERAAKKAQAEIKALIDQALANGTAKPAPKP